MKIKSCCHPLHLVISVLFFPWFVVWIILAYTVSKHNRLVVIGIKREILSTQKDILEELKKLNKGE